MENAGKHKCAMIEKILSSNHKILFISYFFRLTRHTSLIHRFFSRSFCKRTTFTSQKRRVKSKCKTCANKAHDLYCHFHLFHCLVLYISTSHSRSFTIPSLIQFSHKHIFIRLIFLTIFFFIFSSLCVSDFCFVVCLFVVTCYRVSVVSFWCQQYG